MDIFLKVLAGLAFVMGGLAGSSAVVALMNALTGHFESASIAYHLAYYSFGGLIVVALTAYFALGCWKDEEA
jgi:hypothetical protein